MKALVTGGRGFVGSFVVEELLKHGFEVTCLLRSGSDGWLKGLNFKRQPGDITAPATLPEAVRGMDYIFHIAGCTKAINKHEFERVNAEGTRKLLAAVHENNPKIKRFVHVSSLAAAGPSADGEPLTEDVPPHPVSDYGRSKLAGERIALSYADKLPVTVVRPPGVYGPRDTDIYNYFKYARWGYRPMLGGGARSASFVYVKDLAAGIFLASQKEVAVEQTYFICDERPYSWKELGETVGQAVGKETKEFYLPLTLALPVAAIADLTARLIRKPSIINLDKYRELKVNHWVCSSARARKDLGFSPRFSLLEGMQETAKWYFEKGWL